MPIHVRIVLGAMIALSAGGLAFLITSDLLAGEVRFVREWKVVPAALGFAFLLGLAIHNKLALRKYRERSSESATATPRAIQ